MTAEGEPKTYQRPNVLPLSLAAFFNDTGSDMLFAFYPLFLVLILKVNMGQLGGLDSIALFARLLLRPITGLIADRKGDAISSGQVIRALWFRERYRTWPISGGIWPRLRCSMKWAGG
jgi:hypothetical protein